MRILFAGGGTGGHIMPVIAIADKLRQLLNQSGVNPEFLLISDKSPFNTAAVNAGISVKVISAYKLRRYASIENITGIINLPIGFIQSLWHLFWYMPDVVFAKGGYVSLPVVLAAWIYRIPIIIHESDSVAGLANSISAKLANKVAISFNEAAGFFSGKKVVFTGNPIRAEIFGANKAAAVDEFGLRSDLPIVLVLGGSQGAQKINEILIEILPKLIQKVQIIHVCGIDNYEELKQEVENLKTPDMGNYRLYPFLYENLREAYAASDLVISRAGANNVAEIINLGKPSILIPLSNSAGDHQLKNAYYFASRGAAILLEETNLTPNMLYDAIFKILENKEKQMQMIRAARSLAIPDAAERAAAEIIKLAR